VLGGRGIELGLILELEQELQRATYSELFVQAALSGRLHALTAARMATAAIGPVQGPQPFGGRPLLYEQLTGAIEDQERKSSMQNALALVASRLAQVPYVLVGCVNQNERIQI
jgi:hypothetical protein